MRARNLNPSSLRNQILGKIDPYFLTGQSFNVLLLEKKRQGNQTALSARATRGLGRPSLDARREGQSGRPAKVRIRRNDRTEHSVNAPGGIAQFGKIECPRCFVSLILLLATSVKATIYTESNPLQFQSTSILLDRWILFSG